MYDIIVNLYVGLVKYVYGSGYQIVVLKQIYIYIYIYIYTHTVQCHYCSSKLAD